MLWRIVVLLIAVSCASGAEVGLWDRIEIAVTNEKEYPDPYRDVTLDVVYTSPGGEKTAFWGFHDGGSKWKLRFMPDEVGIWRYESWFSDGSAGVNGSFECVVSDLPGMISVYRKNPIWFGYRGGRPVLVRSLHAGDRFFASNWSDGKRVAFLDWFQAQGYNMLSVASHYLNRAIEGRGKEWDTPRLWPLDAAEYRRMEGLLNDLARRKILVYPFAGFFGKNSNYPRDPVEQELYVRYTLARLGPYWNLLFNAAGPEPNLRRTWMQAEDVVRLGKLIAGLDVFGHPLSVHNRTGDDPYVSSSWTTYGILQGPKTVNRKRLSVGLLRNHHPEKPLYAQETLWAGNKYHKEQYTLADLRKNAYVIGMSGASLNFGDMNGDSSSGFSGSMELSERFQERHDAIRKVWDLFEAADFHELRPRQDLVDHGYCLAAPGRRYLVYLEERGLVNVAVVEAEYDARWINAQDTEDVRTAGVTVDGKGMSSPTDGDDWILELRAREEVRLQ